jgi:hypothetical protein
VSLNPPEETAGERMKTYDFKRRRRAGLDAKRHPTRSVASQVRALEDRIRARAGWCPSRERRPT